MLTIRTEQLHALGRASASAYESRLVEHCVEFAPRLSALRGPLAVQKLVRLGVERARLHGFDHRGPVRFWLELMLAQGSRWHDDPMLEPVTRHLARSDLQQNFRADLVYEALQEHVARVDGDDKSEARAALQRMLQIDWTAVVQPAPSPEARALALLAQLHPRKLDVAGHAAAEQVVRAAGDACRRLRIDADEGQVLLAGLMCGFGHGALEDPMYPWIAATLQPGRADALRCARLARKARLYVRAVIAHWSP